MSSGQFFGIIMTVLSSFLIGHLGDQGCLLSQCLLIIAGIIAGTLSFFVKEDLKRIRDAKEKEDCLKSVETLEDGGETAEGEVKTDYSMLP